MLLTAYVSNTKDKTSYHFLECDAAAAAAATTLCSSNPKYVYENTAKTSVVFKLNLQKYSWEIEVTVSLAKS